MWLLETKRRRCFPKQAPGALERRARLLLLLQACLAATKCNFTGPLRREEDVLENEEGAENTALRRSVLLVDSFKIDALSSQMLQK